MYSDEIINRIKSGLPKIKSITDFVSWLNIIQETKVNEPNFEVEDVLSCNIYGTSLPNYIPYYVFRKKKKSGGYREIYAPNKSLRSIQIALKEIFNILYENPEFSHGFVQNKSIISNAAQHVEKCLVVNIDIKDFFNSINNEMIKDSLIFGPDGFSEIKPEILDRLISICTHNVIGKDKIEHNILPHGSPVSPILSNIVCVKLDYALNSLARQNGFKYSRYVDDITFSSYSKYLPKSFFDDLKEILYSECKFVINGKKTRFQNSKKKQVVTGLVVNKKVNVDRKFLKNVRMLLHIYEKFDEQLAESVFKGDKNFKNISRYGTQPKRLYQVLRGKIEFVGMIKGKDNPVYLKLLNRYCERKEFLKLNKGTI